MNEPQVRLYHPYLIKFSEPVNLRIQRGGNPKPVTQYVVAFFLNSYRILCYKTPGAKQGFMCNSDGALSLVSRKEYTVSKFWPIVESIQEVL